jgi:hypothetical protein
MGDKRTVYRVLVRKGGLREREHLEDIGVDGRTMIIIDLQEEGEGSINWSDLAQDRDRCRVVSECRENLRVT